MSAVTPRPVILPISSATLLLTRLFRTPNQTAKHSAINEPYSYGLASARFSNSYTSGRTEVARAENLAKRSAFATVSEMSFPATFSAESCPAFAKVLV